VGGDPTPPNQQELAGIPRNHEELHGSGRNGNLRVYLWCSLRPHPPIILFLALFRLTATTACCNPLDRIRVLWVKVRSGQARAVGCRHSPRRRVRLRSPAQSLQPMWCYSLQSTVGWRVRQQRRMNSLPCSCFLRAPACTRCARLSTLRCAHSTRA
jgi:hypothetical protein